MKLDYNKEFINDVIHMAWADDISFDKIEKNTGLSEADVIRIMRSHLKLGSFKLWRKRVTGRYSKHEKRAHIFEALAMDNDYLISKFIHL